MTKSASHPLVGAGVHRRGADGLVESQSKILAVFPSGSSTIGDLALLQYFSALPPREPTTRWLIPVTELSVGEHWVLYEDVEEMAWYWHHVEEPKHERAERHRDAAEQQQPDERPFAQFARRRRSTDESDQHRADR